MASIENIENLPPLENLTISGHKPQPSKNVKQKLSVSSDRKKLQTLQASGVNDQVLNRSSGTFQNSGGKPKSFKVFEDPKTKKKVDCSVAVKVVSKTDGGTQVEEKDVAQAKAENFMYAEEYPPEYWKELYEKTREALETSLVENEELHTSIGLIEDEKSALIEEKDALKDMVQNANELAKILNAVMSDEEESEGSSDEDGSEEDCCEEGKESE